MRAIHLFPEFLNLKSIDDLREKYDPLFGLIQPHLTLVFPFESKISIEDLADHLRKSLIGLKPFKIVMSGISGVEDEYLFLNVKVGNDEIIQLHDRLYSGLLKNYLDRHFTYTPHLTIGRIKNKKTFEIALAETEGFNEIFETLVQEIVLESIDKNGKSKIELKMPL